MLLKKEDRIVPTTFIGKGDLVKLNKMGLCYFEEEAGSIYKVDDITIDRHDLFECIDDNGKEFAKYCTCYMRYTLKTESHELKDVCFDELSIYELK